jgi:hypothetical protein
MEIRALTEDEVNFTVSAVEDDLPEDGRLSNDDDQNAGLWERLDSYEDKWAWARVTVTAEWKGLEGLATAGKLTYADKDDFEDSPLSGQMKVVALRMLNKRLALVANALAQLKKGNG